MKISLIAARLRKVASDLDTLAAHNDYDLPDDMVLPLIQNVFADDNLLREFVSNSPPASKSASSNS